MTSTLPNFSASSAVPAAPATAPNAAALLPASGAPAGVAVPPGGFLLEFSALLPAVSGVMPRVAPASVPVAVLPLEGEGAPAETCGPTGRTLLHPGLMVAPLAPAGVAATENQPARPHGISREEFEHAAAFVVALLQSLAPVTPAAPAVPDVPTAASGEASAVLPALSPLSAESPAGPAPGSPVRSTGPMRFGGQALPPTCPMPARPAIMADRMDAVESAAPAVPAAVTPPADAFPAVAGAGVMALTPASAAPVFTVAADGAIELKIELPARPEADFQPGVPDETPLEVCAELELPGQAVIRVEATVPPPVAESGRFAAAERQVIFAGRPGPEKSAMKTSGSVLERKFVFTGDKQVSTASPDAGITVAKTDGTMSVVPTEETRNPRHPEAFSVLPLRADFQVVQSPAERITVAPTESAGQNFAERAVATVTGLAEAQFSVSMHKAGSVQLRLKFGGEDLSVRVELREGVVHTDFRTDSPALREALTQEWQAVAAAAPGQLQRFLDPVFSPASPSGATDQGAQHHSFSRQSPQQQAQDQSARPDGWPGQSPFSRRSALGESFIPEPAAPRVPVLLPTSLRLSVLA